MTSMVAPAIGSLQFFFCLMVLGTAGFAHGMFGFGFAMIATPLLALFVGYRLAIFLAAVPLLCMSLLFLIANRHLMRSEAVTRAIVPGIVLGSVAGAFLQASLSPPLALVLLATLLAASAALPVYLRDRQLGLAGTGRASSAMSATLGMFAGVTESALNVGAPFVLFYGGLARLDRLQQLLALNLCFAVGKSVQIAVLTQASSAYLSPSSLVIAVVAALAGQIAGNRCAGVFSERSFRRMFAAFLYGVSGFLLFRAVLELGG
jgi:uncharacterized protein